MRTIRNVSMGLIAISLSLPIWSALYLIPFVQPERNQIAEGQIHYMFSYENFVHEAGFGRLAISIIALLILLIPYRRGERWAFAALVILAVAYYVPVFLFGAIPNLGSWPLFRNWIQTHRHYLVVCFTEIHPPGRSPIFPVVLTVLPPSSWP